MLGYLFVLISSLSGAAKGYVGKNISSKTAEYPQAIFVNIVRMLLCIIISLASMLAETHRISMDMDTNAIIYGCMSGITTSLFVVSWLLCIQRGAFMLISVAQMFGVVITIALSFAVFGETVTAKQLVGILFLIAAVLVMLSYNLKLNGKMTAATLFLLLLCGVSNGLCDFSLKLYTSFSASSVSTLNLITYIVAAVFLGICSLASNAKNSFNARELFKETFVPVALMAICLFLNTFFKAQATKYLSATQIYPVYQALGLILSAAMSSLFFKERLSKRCVIGLVLAFMALIFINM